MPSEKKSFEMPQTGLSLLKPITPPRQLFKRAKAAEGLSGKGRGRRTPRGRQDLRRGCYCSDAAGTGVETCSKAGSRTQGKSVPEGSAEAKGSLPARINCKKTARGNKSIKKFNKRYLE